jgi:hypothetical protein
MKIRNLLVGFVLAMMVLFAGSFKTNTAQASGCGDICYRWLIRHCEPECNGDPDCLSACNYDYNCCLYQCQNPTNYVCP